MKPNLLHHALALLLAGALAAPAAAQTAAAAPKAHAMAKKKAAKAAPSAPVLEPRALELMQAMSQRLAAAQRLQFTAIASYEYPSRLGPPIVYTMRYDVAFQRPSRIEGAFSTDQRSNSRSAAARWSPSRRPRTWSR